MASRASRHGSGALEFADSIDGADGVLADRDRFLISHGCRDERKLPANQNHSHVFHRFWRGQSLQPVVDRCGALATAVPSSERTFLVVSPAPDFVVWWEKGANVPFILISARRESRVEEARERVGVADIRAQHVERVVYACTSIAVALFGCEHGGSADAYNGTLAGPQAYRSAFNGSAERVSVEGDVIELFRGDLLRHEVLVDAARAGNSRSIGYVVSPTIGVGNRGICDQAPDPFERAGCLGARDDLGDLWEVLNFLGRPSLVYAVDAELPFGV